MENIVFKQSFMGFNRTEVLSYIDELANEIKLQNQEYAVKEEKLQQEIASLNENVKINDGKIEKSIEYIEKMNKDLIAKSQENEQLKQAINDCKVKINERNQVLFNLKTDMDKVIAENKALNDKNTYWNNKENEISKSIIDANIQAKDIVVQAKEEATKAKENLYIQAANLTKQVNEVRMNIQEIEHQIDDSFNKLKNVVYEIDHSSKEIEQQLTTYSIGVSNINIEKPVISPKSVRYEKVEDKNNLLNSVLETITKMLK